MKYITIILFVLAVSSWAAIAPYGVIENIEGRVEVMPEGGVLWESASNGMKLRHNDRIRTFTASRCRVLFQDSSYIDFGELSGLLFNNAIHEKSEVIERIFSQVRGHMTFSIAQFGIKGEAHNWIKVLGMELQTKSSLLTIHANDSLVQVDVLSESTWIKGEKINETLLFRGQRINYSPQKKKGAILDISDIDRIEKSNRKSGVDLSVSGEKLYDLSDLNVVMPVFDERSDSIKSFERWDLVGVLQQVVYEGFKPEVKKIISYKNSLADPAMLPLDMRGYDLVIQGRVESFTLEELPGEVRLQGEVYFKVFDGKSGVLEREVACVKSYSVARDVNNNFKLLRHMPIDINNQKFKKSILFSFFDDVKNDLIGKLKDPL